MSRTIETTIDINAPASRVWDVLTQFERFPEWSQFILAIVGDVHPQKQIEIRLNDGGSKMTLKPMVIVRKENAELGWRGQVGASFLFTGEHRFKLQPTSDGKTRFFHSEQFSGLLIPIFWKTLNTRTRRSFEAFNEALRARAEAAGA